MSYVNDTVRGIAWIGAFRFGTRAVSFGKTILLARLLTPSQFGIFGVAALTLSLLEVLTETGINTILIQQKKGIEDYIDSAWSVSILRGFIISFVMVLLSVPVALFFNIPESTPLILLASLVPTIRGFINPSEVIFQKDLLFKKEFMFRTAIFIVDAVVSIYLSIVTRNPISLVWGILAGATFEMVLSHLMIKPRPRIDFNNIKVLFILKRGRWITITGILDYLIQNGDNIIVGRVLGSSALGFYQMSYQVSTLPVTEISNILSKVMLPIFVKLSGTKKHILSAYFQLLFVLTAFVGIICLLLLLFASTIVQLVLGDTWMTIVTTIQILALFAFVKSIVLSSYAFFLAIERQEIVTAISLFGFASMFITIIPLIHQFGINGAAYAALLGSIISLFPMSYYLLKERNASYELQ